MKSTKGLIRTAAALGAAGIISIGSISTALAQTPVPTATPAATATAATEARQGLFGTVTAKSDTGFTIKKKDGTTVEIAVNADTQFKAKGEDEASLANLAVGSRVAVHAQAGTALTALRVMAIPSEPKKQHRVLTVTSISGKTLTAQDDQGNTITVELDHELSEDIKGQLVTFIGEHSAQSNKFKANVEVKIQQVVKRLEEQAKKAGAEAKAAVDVKVKSSKEEKVKDLRARLESNMQRHLELFAEVIAKAPEQAKPSLQAALEATINGYKVALEAAGEGKAEAAAKLEHRAVSGTVSAVAATGGEIMVTTKGNATVAVKTDANTKVMIGDQAGTLANIAAGDVIEVRYDPQTQVATQIRVRVNAEVKGTIQSVDSAGSAITISTKGGTLTLKLVPGTEIEINDDDATAADLKANAEVEVEYNTKTLEISEISAETAASIKGTVKSIDAAAGTLVVTTEGGKEVTLSINDATRVNVQGMLFGSLGIAAGMKIEARYDTATGVATAISAEVKGGSSGRK